MGKTIQAISLMLANRPGPQHTESWDKSDRDHDREVNPKMRAGTLVVCPLIALLQWQSEIAKFTLEGSLKVGDDGTYFASCQKNKAKNVLLMHARVSSPTSGVTGLGVSWL